MRVLAFCKRLSVLRERKVELMFGFLKIPVCIYYKKYSIDIVLRQSICSNYNVFCQESVTFLKYPGNLLILVRVVFQFLFVGGQFSFIIFRLRFTNLSLCFHTT